MSAQLAHVTFTGADHTVDLLELREFLAAQRPGSIELAVLVSQSKAGTERYPLPGLARELLIIASETRQRGAVHLCGAIARRLVLGGVEAAFRKPDWQGADNAEPFLDVVWQAERVQVNLADDLLHAEDQQALVAALGKSVILQLRGGTIALPAVPGGDTFPPAAEGVSWLFDPSGGRGREPDAWPRLPSRRGLFGFAGGIGPENAAVVVRSIVASAPGSPARFWIDMETKVRETKPGHHGFAGAAPTTFSIARCRAVMDAVAPFLG